MEKIIARGAEATISLSEGKILKTRIPKSYRLPELDKKIRIGRTRSETKLLKKVEKLIPVPKVLELNETNKTIILENISGKKLSKHLEKIDFKKVGFQIGKDLAKLHDFGIIHGDLTTSNLILKKEKVFFIDFGLGFHSNRIEDCAVDLHLLKEALNAKHPTISKSCFLSILKGYKKSKRYSSTLSRLEKVEKRGRYKSQY